MSIYDSHTEVELRGLMSAVGMDVPDVISNVEIAEAARRARMYLDGVENGHRSRFSEGFTFEDRDEAKRNPAEPLMRRALDTYAARRAAYGPSEQRFADIAMAHFPNGIRLETRTEWVRFGLLVQILSKLCRYTNDFSNPHVDSIHDLGPYAHMLEAEDRRALKLPPFYLMPEDGALK